MIGVYKITSPSGKIYIGQSINVEKRFKDYQYLSCKSQVKIYASLKKYGVKSHKFEVLNECTECFLNDLERYYQELYDCVENGLNCGYVGTKYKKYRHSEETKRKISQIHMGNKYTLGRPKSEETKRRISETLKGRKVP